MDEGEKGVIRACVINAVKEQFVNKLTFPGESKLMEDIGFDDQDIVDLVEKISDQANINLSKYTFIDDISINTLIEYSVNEFELSGGTKSLGVAATDKSEKHDDGAKILSEDGRLMCPNCGSRMLLRDTKIIYGKSFGKAWICRNFPKCDTYVGAHRDGSPKGTPAGKELRGLRMECHKLFDPLWKENKLLELKKKIGNGSEFSVPERPLGYNMRKWAYVWLSQIMNVEQAHIAEFNKSECHLMLKKFEEAGIKK